MKIDTYYKAKAEEIHKTCPVVDTHLDLAGELVFRLRNGEENPLRDIYLPAFRKGGFDLIVSSIYLQNHELPEGGLRAALEQIVVLKEQIRKNPEFLEIRSVERSGPVPGRSSDWNYSLYGRPGLHRIRCEASDRSVGIGGTRGFPYLEQEKSAGVRLLQGK